MNEMSYKKQLYLGKAVSSATGILRQYTDDVFVRKITVTARGKIYIYTAPFARKFTGEYMDEEDLRRIIWSVTMLPQAAIKRLCGSRETKKFEAIFMNGWKIRSKKSKIWDRHSMVFEK